MSSPQEIESKIKSLNMVSLGTRRPDVLQARLKIKGWSENMRKEIGVGYEAMVINSKGEQFGDFASEERVAEVLDTKDVFFAKEYIAKMANLNESLIKRMENNSSEFFEEELSLIFTYFMIIRAVIEHVFTLSSSEDQKLIEDWRNDTTLFKAFIKYFELHPEVPHASEWSVLGLKDEIIIVDKLISFEKKHTIETATKEVKGKVGYPGVICGKARVVVTREDRDAVETGEIIVTTMTTLDFIHAMEKASAFITDEGGITCHAAIVAREMKKPCIIGTRNGTQIIKTGDMLEVDAKIGIVKILI